jgi:hypothetical protein
VIDKDFSKKRVRGRPPKIDSHIVVGTAKVFQSQFSLAWPEMGKQFLAAKSAVEVWDTIKAGRGVISNVDFFFAERVYQIIQDPKFPKLRAKAQVEFLANSLGGCGMITARRSREICAKERAKVHHVIVRKEFYIECSCGYAGPALNGSCRRCGTVELSEQLMERESYGY